VTDVAHAQVRAAGALIEEAVDEEDDDADADAGVGYGEELMLDEKAALASDAPVVYP
jgi:hypothetical protein